MKDELYALDCSQVTPGKNGRAALECLVSVSRLFLQCNSLFSLSNETSAMSPLALIPVD